jgi:hypothetical protein
MNCSFDYITNVIKNNPSKERIMKGREMADKLMLHLYGIGMESALAQCKYFENNDIYSVRKQYAVSNKDLFSRVLQQEDMVFSAKGGSSYYNLSENDEKQMSALLDEVRYGEPLRKWIRNFALPAWRADPMSVIFMEVEKMDINSRTAPKAYPTYKSIYSIYDYLPSGRRLEYICFNLTASQAIAFGINDPELKDYAKNHKTTYFRFVDDVKDIFVKWTGDEVKKVGDQVENIWGITPGFVTSNLMMFNDPSCFLSPLDATIELADSFLTDRSIRDLQKRYHGFSKAVEPLLTCSSCDGTGTIAGNACPECLPAPGATQGTGYKMKTKVSDVARFPMNLFESAGFDFRKIFGYVTPDIEGWEKQDSSLSVLESLINMTYWGTGHAQTTSGPSIKTGQAQPETATKTLDDRQPRYSRLNQTAEWCEKTEMLIADFIGKFWFNSFKKSFIAYGRYYILETPDELMVEYQQMRSSGAPEASLYEALEKYYHSVYQNSPIELAVRLKLLYVEPFPHLKIGEAKMVVTDPLDFNCKLYFGEWYSTMKDIEIVVTATNKLRDKLREYVKNKNIPTPVPAPSAN